MSERCSGPVHTCRSDAALSRPSAQLRNPSFNPRSSDACRSRVSEHLLTLPDCKFRPVTAANGARTAAANSVGTAAATDSVGTATAAANGVRTAAAAAAAADDDDGG